MPHGRHAWRRSGPHGCARRHESRSQPETATAASSFNRPATRPKSGMDPRNESMGSEVWTRYGIGSMNEARSGSIRSCRFMRAWRRKSARSDCGGSRSWCPISNCSRGQFLDEWAIWSSEGAPAKLRFNLVWAAQCAPKSRENSLYDPAHGAPELPESSGICPSPPCGHAWDL